MSALCCATLAVIDVLQTGASCLVLGAPGPVITFTGVLRAACRRTNTAIILRCSKRTTNFINDILA